MFMLRFFGESELLKVIIESIFFPVLHMATVLLLSGQERRRRWWKKRARSDLHMRIFWIFRMDKMGFKMKWNGMEWTDLSDEKCFDIKYTQLDTNVINDMIYAEHCAQKEEDKEEKKKHTHKTAKSTEARARIWMEVHIQQPWYWFHHYKWKSYEFFTLF